MHSACTTFIGAPLPQHLLCRIQTFWGKHIWRIPLAITLIIPITNILSSFQFLALHRRTEVAHPEPTKEFLELDPETAMLHAPFRCTHPPPHPPFLLMQNWSPKDIAGKWYQKMKVSNQIYVLAISGKGYWPPRNQTIGIQNCDQIDFHAGPP